VVHEQAAPDRPPTTPTVATIHQIDDALRRSSSSNTVMRIDRVLGITSAAPPPSARGRR
jgi:hypothetical protein